MLMRLTVNPTRTSPCRIEPSTHETMPGIPAILPSADYRLLKRPTCPGYGFPRVAASDTSAASMKAAATYPLASGASWSNRRPPTQVPNACPA